MFIKSDGKDLKLKKNVFNIFVFSGFWDFQMFVIFTAFHFFINIASDTTPVSGIKFIFQCTPTDKHAQLFIIFSIFSLVFMKFFQKYPTQNIHLQINDIWFQFRT